MKPIIRALKEVDLDEADRISRIAFGTFLGLLDPGTFYGDADFVRTRFRADPSLSLAAEMYGQLVGSNFVANWGSVGFFGPLTVRPDLWDKGIGKNLLNKTLEIFERLGTKHIGLFTFSHSPKHIHFYQKYDFWPRFLTNVMSKPVGSYSKTKEHEAPTPTNWFKYSDVPHDRKSTILGNCSSLTNSIYKGLDLRNEIVSITTQKLGEIILLKANAKNDLGGLAVCHCGPRTEAGSGTCYVKFGMAANEGQSAPDNFDHLLEACERYAASQGLMTLLAGVNIGNLGAYRKMISKGFKTEYQGVMMTKNNDPGYHKEDVYAIDDWR